MLRRPLGWILLVALIGASGVVHAQPAGVPRAPFATLPSSSAADRQRLRSELERVNAEIDALKRESRGLRDDYRLRNRMADAEALARRLTELDARSATVAPAPSSSPGVAPESAATWPAAPQAAPLDDRAVLEAKADILADQALRLTRQADSLAGRVSDLRGRQELRRRAGQLERDPFSPLEQAKRRLAATGASAASPTNHGSGPAGAPTDLAGRGEGAGAASPPPTKDSVSTVAGGGTPTAAGTGNNQETSGGPTPGSGLSLTGAPAGPAGQLPLGSSPSSAAGSVNKLQPSLMSPGNLTVDTAGSVAMQYRGILDPATLSEIRRLELAGSPSGSLSAMERALSGLRARAAELAANANVLRGRAKATK